MRGDRAAGRVKELGLFPWKGVVQHGTSARPEESSADSGRKRLEASVTAARSCELTTQDGSPERFWAECVD